MKALQIQKPVEERNITTNIFSVITFWSAKKTDYGPVHFPKYFLCHPSHRIFRPMHGALNVGKKNN
jgi:hypothetical protein